jgi:hypothetical protein
MSDLKVKTSDGYIVVLPKNFIDKSDVLKDMTSILGFTGVQTESVQTESVQTESVQTESVQTESAQTESVPMIQVSKRILDLLISEGSSEGEELPPEDVLSLFYAADYLQLKRDYKKFKSMIIYYFQNDKFSTSTIKSLRDNAVAVLLEQMSVSHSQCKDILLFCKNRLKGQSCIKTALFFIKSAIRQKFPEFQVDQFYDYLIREQSFPNKDFFVGKWTTSMQTRENGSRNLTKDAFKLLCEILKNETFYKFVTMLSNKKIAKTKSGNFVKFTFNIYGFPFSKEQILDVSDFITDFKINNDKLIKYLLDSDYIITNYWGLLGQDLDILDLEI